MPFVDVTSARPLPNMPKRKGRINEIFPHDSDSDVGRIPLTRTLDDEF